MEAGEKRKDVKHHGTQYSLWVQYSSDSLSISAEEIDSGIQWHATFQPDFIEELTRKTGNFKRFSVFVRMIVAAMEGTSRTVTMELISHLQMEALRSKKTSKRQITPSNPRLYLILTYKVEFDKVHYPLPLGQSEPSPEELRRTVRQLRLQIDGLKRLIPPQSLSEVELVQENVRLREEVSRLREAVIEKVRVEAMLTETKGEMEKERQRYLGEMEGMREEMEGLKREVRENTGEATPRESEELVDTKQALEAALEDLQATKEEVRRLRAQFSDSTTHSLSRTHFAFKSFQSSTRYDPSPPEDEELSPSDDLDSRVEHIQDLLRQQDLL